jgi:hypothetical protein
MVVILCSKENSYTSPDGVLLGDPAVVSYIDVFQMA